MLKEGVILGERYEIISRIGSGGMADVYKAKDHKLNRMVAVKVLKPEFREDKTFIRKFRTEAQAAAGLSHPNIVNVYDVGEDRGVYYIVMELVEGITLKDYIDRKGKLSVKEATSIAIQVSLGLEAAHNRNIVHRDVKPQNIIISTDGKVKLSDFGIAKATSSNTISSNVMGSVHYSSPEQVRGGYSDYKSDIYSLGITMYEMVTGRVPFDGDTTVAIAIKHLQEEIESPSKYTPNLPFALEQIILKCTQKSPDRRYNNMAELIDDLKHSLMEPQGNFVKVTPLSSHAETVMVSAEELSQIRSGAAAKANAQTAEEPARKRYSKIEDEEEDEDYSYEDEEDEDEDEEEDDRDSYDEDDDDSYYDDDDDDDKAGNKLEKIITIGGFAIAAIIICMLIYFIAQAAGIVGGKGPTAASSGSASITSWNLSRMIVWILSRVAELIGCAISRYSPSVALRLGIAINNPFSPSITLISCTTNSSSIVMETTAFIFPSFATFLTRTSVIFMIQIYSFRFTESIRLFYLQYISVIFLHDDLHFTVAAVIRICTNSIPAFNNAVLNMSIISQIYIV